MKLFLFFAISLFSLVGHSQVGKLNIQLSLVNADTTSTYFPYMVDTWIQKRDLIVSRIAMQGSGLHYIGDFQEGFYNLELHDNTARRMKIDSVKITADSTTTINIAYPGFCKFIYPENYKPICPLGHSNEVVKILYGFPTNKAMRDSKKGLIYLGGCTITNCDPKYYCKKHKIQF